MPIVIIQKAIMQIKNVNTDNIHYINFLLICPVEIGCIFYAIKYGSLYESCQKIGSCFLKILVHVLIGWFYSFVVLFNAEVSLFFLQAIIWFPVTILI